MSSGLRHAPLVLAAISGLLLAGCSGGDTPGTDTSATPTTSEADASPEPEETPAAPALSGELVVFAAASLQDTFTQIGDQLMTENPDLEIVFNFGASSALSQQLLSGAPADVFAAANTSTMENAAEVTDTPVLFAHNSLEIVVPQGNPAGITGLADFTNPDLKIALCAVEVPCGSAAAKAFEAAGLTPAPDTYEQDVTATLTKAVMGEVDAALVYKTDVLSAGDDVEGIEFPEAAQALNDYPIATLKDAPNREAAEAFVALVLSAVGQQVLIDAGFDGV